MLDNNDTLTPSEFEKYIGANMMLHAVAEEFPQDPNTVQKSSAENSGHIMLMPTPKELSSGGAMESIPNSGPQSEFKPSLKDSQEMSKRYISIEQVHEAEGAPSSRRGNSSIYGEERVPTRGSIGQHNVDYIPPHMRQAAVMADPISDYVPPHQR